jgi:hypothetical protein
VMLTRETSDLSTANSPKTPDDWFSEPKDRPRKCNPRFRQTADFTGQTGNGA